MEANFSTTNFFTTNKSTYLLLDPDQKVNALDFCKLVCLDIGPIVLYLFFPLSPIFSRKCKEHKNAVKAIVIYSVCFAKSSWITTMNNNMCSLNRDFKPTEIQMGLLSAKVLFKSTQQRIVPVGKLNVSGHKKVICKNSKGVQYISNNCVNLS